MWIHEFINVAAESPWESKEIVDLIGELYAVDGQCPRGPPGNEVRRVLRNERSRAIVQRIGAWVYATYPNTSRKAGSRRRFGT